MIFRRGSASRRDAGATSSPTRRGCPRVAAITMVRNEAAMLPRWVQHYTRQCGSPDALVVIDDNSSDGSTDDLPCTVIRLPTLDKQPFEPARMGLISGVADGLLNAYDAVVFSDADELVVPDPALYADLRELLADRPERDAHGVVALNVIHDLAREAPLDPHRPVLEQRRLAKFIPLMCKPAVKTVPARWGHASHGVFAPYSVDPALYMFHLKFADRDLLHAAAEHRRQMVELDGRAHSTSWRHSGDEMLELLRSVNEGLDPAEAAEFVPPERKLRSVVEKQPNGLYRAVGKGQVAAMRSQPPVSVPARFRSLA